MTKQPPILTPENVIVCDDVRREDNGKIILIGVYNNIVVVKNFPTLFAVKFWIQCKATSNGTVPLKLRIMKDKKKHLSKTTAEILVERGSGDNFGFVLGSPPFNLESPCTLTLKWQQPGRRWQTLKEFIVEKGG